MTRGSWLTVLGMALPPIALAAATGHSTTQPADRGTPRFEAVQPELFGDSGGQPNLWADVDGDGDADLFVGFRGRPNRLYLNEAGRFRDVAAQVGLADEVETRAAAWGDFDADGDPDLYVGFADGKTPARVYRNDGAGTRFTDVAKELGIELAGVSRQPAWIDYDGDGDIDLYAAFRDKPNRLFRNDGGRFADVSKDAGIDDPRKTVGAVWWDFDRDGDLDVFVANQEGDANGFFRNANGRFTDAAAELGVDAAGRPKDEGGVGPAVADYDLDGDLDLFVANYGPSVLYRNDEGRAFTAVTRELGVDVRTHVTTAAWGDVDADGWPDLYLAAFLADQPHYRDWLFRNGGSSGGAPPRFTEVLPDVLLERDATHGVQFVDFDRDGALDLSLTNNDPKGGHHLFRNVDAASARGLSVLVTDEHGHLTRAGAEVRLYAAGTRRLLASGLVDSGSGYCAQSAGPVFLGVPAGTSRADLEITIPARGARTVMTIGNLDPAAFRKTPVQAREALRTPPARDARKARAGLRRRESGCPDGLRRLRRGAHRLGGAALGGGRAEHRDRRIQDDEEHEDPDGQRRQRRHQPDGQQHGERAAQRQAECGAQVVGLAADELDARDGHQEGARAHHDGEGGAGIHAEDADEHHARRVEADAERHEGAEDEVACDADPELRAGERQRLASGREIEQLRHDDHGGAEQRRAHPDLHAAPREAGHDARAEPRAGAGRGNHQEQRAELDLDDGDEHERLDDGADRVAHVERAGNLLVRHELPRAVGRGRGCERADAERIEEVREEPDAEMPARGQNRFGCRVMAGGPLAARQGEPHDEVGERQCHEGGEQQRLGIHGMGSLEKRIGWRPRQPGHSTFGPARVEALDRPSWEMPPARPRL